MRVWDIHPGYLSRQNLLGQHAEIHALYSVISGEKDGYANHPETRRWQGRLERLRRVHDLTVLEMDLRGFKHRSPCVPLVMKNVFEIKDNAPCYLDTPLEQISIIGYKNREKARSGRIPLPQSGYEYWAHHKYSVMARGYNYYKDIQAYLRAREICPIEEAGELIELIAKKMSRPVTAPALGNVVDHLWGYFKREATGPEKSLYLNRQPDELPALVRYLYTLAVKYNRTYLLHSTVFADFTKPGQD